MLDCLASVVTGENLAAVRELLVATLAPLDLWTTAVVTTLDDKFAYEYAVMVGLKDLSEGIARLGMTALSEDQREWVETSIDMATTFLSGTDKIDDAKGVATEGDKTAAGLLQRGSAWRKFVGRGQESITRSYHIAGWVFWDAQVMRISLLLHIMKDMCTSYAMYGIALSSWRVYRSSQLVFHALTGHRARFLRCEGTG